MFGTKTSLLNRTALFVIAYCLCISITGVCGGDEKTAVRQRKLELRPFNYTVDEVLTLGRASKEFTVADVDLASDKTQDDTFQIFQVPVAAAGDLITCSIHCANTPDLIIAKAFSQKQPKNLDIDAGDIYDQSQYPIYGTCPQTITAMAPAASVGNQYWVFAGASKERTTAGGLTNATVTCRVAAAAPPSIAPPQPSGEEATSKDATTTIKRELLSVREYVSKQFYCTPVTPSPSPWPTPPPRPTCAPLFSILSRDFWWDF